MLFLGLAIGLLVFITVVFAFRVTFRVEEGHAAVLVAFGRAETSSSDDNNDKKRTKKDLVTYGPGLHWKKPWEKVVCISMKEQNLDLNVEEGGGMAMADDGTILRLDSFLRYVPVKEVLYEHVFGVERPAEHITGLFTCLLRNEIANFRETAKDQQDDVITPAPAPAAVPVLARTSSTSLATRTATTATTTATATAAAGFDFAAQAGSYALIRRERRLLNEAIKQFCEDRIDNRYGVRFVAVDLADILPPDEIADALNAVMRAQSEAEALLFRAEGECQQKILAAECGVQIAQTHASALEVEIKHLSSFLQDLEARGVLGAYVARRRSEVASESRSLFVKEVS